MFRQVPRQLKVTLSIHDHLHMTPIASSGNCQKKPFRFSNLLERFTEPFERGHSHDYCLLWGKTADKDQPKKKTM